jgi:hypothetical protein
MYVIELISIFPVSFSDEEEVRQKTKEFFHSAKFLLKMDIDNVSLDTIHASILVGNLCGAEGETAGEALFFGKRCLLVDNFNASIY